MRLCLPYPFLFQTLLPIFSGGCSSVRRRLEVLGETKPHAWNAIPDRDAFPAAKGRLSVPSVAQCGLRPGLDLSGAQSPHLKSGCGPCSKDPAQPLEPRLLCACWFVFSPILSALQGKVHLVRSGPQADLRADQLVSFTGKNNSEKPGSWQKLRGCRMWDLVTERAPPLRGRCPPETRRLCQVSAATPIHSCWWPSHGSLSWPARQSIQRETGTKRKHTLGWRKPSKPLGIIIIIIIKQNVKSTVSTIVSVQLSGVEHIRIIVQTARRERISGLSFLFL